MQFSPVLALLLLQHPVHALQSQHRKIRNSRSIRSDVKRVDLNLCTTDIHANLGGLGGVDVGNIGPEDKTEDGKWKKELRYKKVATLPTGEKLDLVVTNLTEYVANPAHKNQTVLLGDPAVWRQGCLGTINMVAPGELELKFELVYRGTDTPAPKNYSYDFTILDIDRSKFGLHEQITTHRFASFIAPNIQPTGPTKAGELYTFAAPKGAVEVPNPELGLTLTGAQLNASVGFVFENVNHWKITAKAIDSPGGIGALEVARNIFFAGKTSLQSMRKSKKPDGKELDDAATKK